MDNFAKKVYQNLRHSAEALKPKKQELQEIFDKIDSGYYSQEAITKDLRPRANAMRVELDKAGYAAILRAKALVDQHRADVEASESLDPAEINDGDMKLLNTGLLRANDIEAILSRNSGNHTMSVLVQRYAQDHGIEISQETRARLGLEHNAAFEEIAAAEVAVDSFERWITEKDAIRVLNGFFGLTDAQAAEWDEDAEAD